MRIIIVILLSSLTIIDTQAQSENVDISIDVVCPEQMDNLSEKGLTRLKHKIEQIATFNGVSSFSDGTFVMYPVFDVFDVRTVEGGMRNISVVEVEMTLFVMELSNKTLISSVSTTLTGHGYGLSESLMNAISEINIKNTTYSNFLTDSKKYIYQYYETNCNKLINKAKTLAAQQQYEAALAELSLFPASLPSYAKVSQVIYDIYTRYQSLRCAQLIQEAKGHIALKDYSEAIDVLFQIDPESRCSSECTTLLDDIRKQVDKEEKEEIERQLKVLNTLVGLEKHRISAARDVAKAYYSNQPKIHYTHITRK